MENKTTTELLDILWNIEKKDEPSDADWDKHSEARAELEKRPPFNELIGEREESNEYSHEERLADIDEDIKLLKRHKHDEKSGDVLVRI
jgi:hypothetical protein